MQNIPHELNAVRHPQLNVAVLMPLRDDWRAALEVIKHLDSIMAGLVNQVEILLVDDGSIEVCPYSSFQYGLLNVKAISRIRLRRNLGHQRAIAIGLAYLERAGSYDGILVMDSDGEDTPDGARLLIEAFVSTRGSQAIFAERSRRTESSLFRSFYLLYRCIHRILTGIRVRVGNFSILPASYLATLVVMPEMWNHYAAALFRSGLPFTMIPIARGYRVAGRSRMNFVALVSHGLSAISVFGDIVGVRILLASSIAFVVVAFAIAVVVVIRLWTDLAIPGWATYASGTLAILFMQLVLVAICFTFFILSSRTNLGFLPIRDHPAFIASVDELYRSEH